MRVQRLDETLKYFLFEQKKFKFSLGFTIFQPFVLNRLNNKKEIISSSFSFLVSRIFFKCRGSEFFVIVTLRSLFFSC